MHFCHPACRALHTNRPKHLQASYANQAISLRLSLAYQALVRAQLSGEVFNVRDVLSEPIKTTDLASEHQTTQSASQATSMSIKKEPACKAQNIHTGVPCMGMP